MSFGDYAMDKVEGWKALMESDLDPSAVARVIEAAEKLDAQDSELSVILHGRLPISREELKDVYPKFRTAYEDLRAALAALRKTGKEEAK